ncbi:MAG: chromosomal replication initiator protein DnaA [Rickettsiales bacterium]|nr:chromosomal replication initiator protein DnaA [Rickettsiales bacterium]|tara:strand:+ start:14374 stop:15732 length:1359 start_codon:yes stop_codon:yes gene_type:complete
MMSPNKTWDVLKPILRANFGDKTYESWLKFLKFEELSNGRIYLSVPTRFLRDWITNRYVNQILRLWQENMPGVLSLEVLVKSEDKTQVRPIDQEDKSVTKPLITQKTKTSSEKENKLDDRYTFDTFVVGKPNELAYAAAQRVADSKTIYFNPLFLHGGVGLGKTHLMHAIAWHINENHPKRKVLYLSAEQFMHRFVRALRHKDIIAFRDQFRSVDVLMIDDVQFISGKDSTQEEFFHTFNALVDKKKQIILSADKSPTELQGLEERVRSRLGWGLVVDIHPSTYELRLGILAAKVESIDLDIPENVIEFLAHKITSNIRELEGALNRIVAHATLVGQKITLESTQAVLRDLLRANDKVITIEEIQKHVAEHYNVRISDMHSNRRLRVVARPRQIAMYLSKKMTTASLPEIGRKFGGRDHTTVMHGVKKIEELLENDSQFADDLYMLENILKK